MWISEWLSCSKQRSTVKLDTSTIKWSVSDLSVATAHIKCTLLIKKKDTHTI